MKNDFFDLQVNGYAGVDFNQNNLTSEDIHKACSQLMKDGVSGILATIITEDIDVMVQHLKRLTHLREQDRLVKKIIRGVHIEGPFLNKKPGYRGAHPVEMIRRADVDLMKKLLDAADGLTRLVTLAPEVDKNFKVINMLANKGIIVSAGHCDPSIDVLSAAINEGLSMFTHLGNGCPIRIHRHDNIIQRALSLRERLWLCFIADGFHVDFIALGNYLHLAGLNRCIVVTDAMAGAGTVPGEYTLGRLKLVVGPDRIVRMPGSLNLAGSALDMQKCKRNLKKYLKLSNKEVFQLTSTNPKKAIGLV